MIDVKLVKTSELNKIQEEKDKTICMADMDCGEFAIISNKDRALTHYNGLIVFKSYDIVVALNLDTRAYWPRSGQIHHRVELIPSGNSIVITIK